MNLLNTVLAKVSLTDFNTFQTSINKKIADNKQELTDYFRSRIIFKN